jgi:hypothetical protein
MAGEYLQNLDQPAQPAADPNTLNALQNLGLFGNRPVEDRNRALLLAGLQMMQPTQTGGFFEGLGGGIQTGIQSLDKTDEAARAAKQQGFSNQIEQQKANATTTTANAATTNAGANVTNAGANVSNAASNATNAETNKTKAAGELELERKKIAQTAKEWNEGLSQREANEIETISKANLNNRMPVITPGKEASINEASLMKDQHSNQMAVLWLEDQQRGINSVYSGKSDPRLVNDAWNVVLARAGSTSSPGNIGIVANTERGGQELNEATVAATTGGLTTSQALTPQEAVQFQALQTYTDQDWVNAINQNDPAVLNLITKRPGLLTVMQQAARRAGMQ